MTTGFVAVDSILDPYSRFVAPQDQLPYETFDRVVHGYYWAVALGGGHLEQLGGLRRASAEAPCEVTEEVTVGDSPGLLCRVTESPEDLTEERVRAWRSYLLPVLRPGYPTDRDQIHRPGGALSRPMWIFEGPVAPRLVRSHLTREIEPKLPSACAEEPVDPELPTFWLHPADGTALDELHDVVAATVGAWRVTGLAGALAGCDGHLRWCSGVTVDTDDDDRAALAWQADLGTCDPEPAVARLAAALDLAPPTGEPPLFERLSIT